MLTQGESPQAGGLSSARQGRIEMEPGLDYARPDWAAASQEKWPRPCSSIAPRVAWLSGLMAHTRAQAHTYHVHNSKSTGER